MRRGVFAPTGMEHAQCAVGALQRTTQVSRYCGCRRGASMGWHFSLTARCWSRRRGMGSVALRSGDGSSAGGRDSETTKLPWLCGA